MKISIEKQKYNKPCKECGGKCCQEMPGSIFAQDLDKPLSESIRRLLKSGFYAIDCWEDDTPIYFMRPKTVKCLDKIFDPSWGGQCIFWDRESGCRLNFEDRPRECRMLEAIKRRGKCIAHSGGKWGAAKSWRPHQVILKRIGEEIAEANQ